jgi:hexosaminidase
MIVEISDDGTNFSEAGKVTNTITSREGPAETQELGLRLNVTTRYIRIKAINGGRLPSWHESAGYPSHLFIDEVIVK